jgi:ribose transport system ATP-binding protein
MENVILEMKQVNKSFDATHAVRDVDFTLRRGEIQALIGENGAGKSTLMNILGGVIQPDSGSMYIDGQKVKISNTLSAREHGIAFIHQELNLVNDLEVYANMFLGDEIKKRSGLLNIEKMCEKSSEILRLLNVDLNPKTIVSELDASYKQIVEIAGAILKNAGIIIMDEPTTSLTDVEIENVFKIMRSLKANGIGIVFISHKLREVVEICDSYSIMRDGAVVASGDIKADNVTEVSLAGHMVKSGFKEAQVSAGRGFGEPIFEVSGYSMPRSFSDVNFSLAKGEILGFTGLLGDGRSELFQSLFGAKSGAKGVVRHKGREMKIKNTTDALKAGIGYVPKNRKENGIIKDLTISENLTLVALKKFIRGILISYKQESECCDREKGALKIKMGNERNLITSLSGGNQQKVVLGKWLESDIDVLILDNPTQGVDVGGKQDIYAIISDLAARGMSIIVLSNEASEILRLCDRVIVMYHGRIVGELGKGEANEELIMRLATGANRDMAG